MILFVFIYIIYIHTHTHIYNIYIYIHLNNARDILLAGPAAAVMQFHEIRGNGWHGHKPSIGCRIPSHVIAEYLQPCRAPARPVAYLGSGHGSAHVSSGWLVPKSSRAFDLIDLWIFYDPTHCLGFTCRSILSVFLSLLQNISIGIVSRLDSSSGCQAAEQKPQR